MSKLNNRRYLIGLIILLLVALVAVTITFNVNRQPSANSSRLQVVAGENFWGSLVSQLGGSKVQVKSIISDPNADPHEYETNTTDARAFANANLVILNGAGYDSWGDKLLSASPNSKRVLLKVATLLGKKEGDNPHFWYSPSYVNTVLIKIEQDLISLDPKSSSYFEQQYSTLVSKLTLYQNQISVIKHQFAGTKVAATEDIFVYLAQASGLDLISPPAFMQAVAEGNDPPASSIVQFQQQLSSGQVKLLVYNTQTVTPLTDSIKQLANDKHIPVIGISETIEPSNLSFQDWMNRAVVNLESTLINQTHG